MVPRQILRSPVSELDNLLLMLAGRGSGARLQTAQISGPPKAVDEDEMRQSLTAAVATAALIAGEAGAQSESARLESLEAQVRVLSQMLEQTTQELQALKEQQTKTDQRVSTLVADDDKPFISTEEDGWKLTLAARINQAILYADQGGDASEAFIVDNDASGSRLEFLAEKSWGDWASGLEIVVSAEVNSTDAIDFGETGDSADENEGLGEFRQAHWFIENPAYGYFSIGQGDKAAEDTAHVDLSGTDFAGAGSDVDDIAGGVTFLDEDGVATTELDDFFDMQDGSRALRALYKTPDFYGLALKASASNDAQSLEDEDDIEGDGLEPQVGFEYAAAFSYGLFAVQAVDPLSTEFYAGARLYTLDEVFRDGIEVDVDSLFAFITGARVRF